MRNAFLTSLCLVVVICLSAQPTFDKTFNPDPIVSGETSVLTFLIDNTAGGSTADALAFIDNLPAGVVVAASPNASTTCGSFSGSAIITAGAGGSSIEFSNANVGAGGSCSVQVDVTSSTIGVHTNTSGDLTSNLGNSGTASDNLTVVPLPTFDKSFSPSIILSGGTSTLTFTIDNSTNPLSATALDFTDVLPAGVVVETPSDASTTCTGGTLTAVDGSGTITYTGGSVGASSTCTVTVDVTSSTLGVHENYAVLNSSLGASLGHGTLKVTDPPSFSKSFSPNPITSGSVSTLTFTIDNTGEVSTADDLDFTDNLPANVVIAATPNASTTCGTSSGSAVITAGAGGSTIEFSNALVGAGMSCTVAVDVTSSTPGTHLNTSGDLTSNLGNSGDASANLTVVPPPTFTKSFSPDLIAETGKSTLTFTIDNSGSGLAASSLTFADNLPAGVVVATPTGQTQNCGGGMVTTSPGSGTISYAGGTVGPGATCTISVDVTSATAGNYTNTTGDLTSTSGNSGTATADLEVVPFFQKEFIPDTIGTGSVTTLKFTVTNPEEDAITNLAFTDNLPAGVTVADQAAILNMCGGEVTAAAGGGAISLSMGTIDPESSCMIFVNVTSNTADTYTNTTSDITGTIIESAYNGGSATDDLFVTDDLPGFTKSFSVPSATVGAAVTLTFTIDNSANGAAVSQLNFADNLPAGMVVAPTPATSTTCAGTVTAAAGSGTVSFAGGSVGANSTCTVSVDVITNFSGDYTNVSDDLFVLNPLSPFHVTSTGKASAEFTAIDLPPAGGISFSKVFTPNTIGPGSTSKATFTITNSNAVPIEDIAFSDDLPLLPGPLTIANPANIMTDCGAMAVVTAAEGGGNISMTGGSLGGGSSCTVMVNVTASTPGVHTNPATSLNTNIGSASSLPVDLTVETTLPGFTKSFAPSTVPLGNKSRLTFTIDNSLNASRVGNLDFTDIFPFGIVIADPPNIFTDCISPTLNDTKVIANVGSNFITLDANGVDFFPGFEVLPIGGSCTVSVDVLTNGVGILNNVSGDLLADFVAAGKASAALEVTRSGLAIQKAFTNDPVAPGGTTTLEFSIYNFDRNFSATDVSFTDDFLTLAPGLPGLVATSVDFNDCNGTVTIVPSTLISLSGGMIPAQGSCNIRVSLDVPPAATPGSYANTTSAVSGTVDGSPVIGNMASDDLYVEPVPILTKEFLEVGTLNPNPIVNPGDDVVLRFTITNTSMTSMATDIAFIDELTDGGPGTGFLPFPVTVTLPPVPDPPCGPGSSLGFVFPDTDRQGLSLTGGSLDAAPGGGSTCTFDVTVTIPATMGPGNYLNTTEEITATVDGSTRIGNPASDDLTIISAPKLSKAFTDDPVAPGNSVTLEFTLSYPPDASGDATDIAFTDDLTSLVPPLPGITFSGLPIAAACDPDGPGGDPGTGTLSEAGGVLTFMGGTLSPGESCTFSTSLGIPIITPIVGSFTNTTSGVSATVEGLPATSAPASDDLKVAGLVFTKEFMDDEVFPGETTTLTFTIENIHPSENAQIFSFSDNLAAALAGLSITGPPSFNDCGGSFITTAPGTTSLTYNGGGTLNFGTSCKIEIEVLVPPGADDGNYINTTSSLIAVQGGVLIIDPAIDDLTVNSNFLQLTKEFTDDPVAPGDPVTLEFTLTNLDAMNAASMIDFTDDLGDALTGLTFDAVLFDDCGGIVSGTGTDMITVTGASLGMGGSCTLRISASVPGGAAPNIYTNTTSTVTGDIGGFAVTGDAATDDLEVVQLLTFSKSFDGPTTATGSTVLTFTITNPGTSTASGIGFTDDLNSVIPGLIATSLPALPCGMSSTITGIGFLTFSGGELPPMGGTCSFDVDVLVPAGTNPGTYLNTTSELSQGGLIVAEPATANLTIEPPPTFAKVFNPDFSGLGQTSTLTFTIDNSASAVAANSLAFVDNLPAGVEIASPSVTSNMCGGTLTAVAGATSISLSGGSVGAGSICVIEVDVTSTNTGALVNLTGDLTSTSGNSGTATDTWTINPQPGFSKSFSPDPILVGGTSTLTFTVDNTGSTVAATQLDFTDNLPAGVTLATPANAVNACGGTLTAADGSMVVSLTGGTVAAGSTCTLSVDVTSSTPGTHLNTTGDLTSSLGNSGTASASITVNPPPSFSKSFGPDPIPVDGISTLTFTIDNSGSTIAASGLDFTDNLPAGMVVATVPNASTTCSGGTLTAVAGTGVISYTGATVPASSSCIVSVDVTSSTPGTHLNTTGDLTSSHGNSGTATASLTVNPPPVFSKEFSPDNVFVGDLTTLTFTIDNSASTQDATGLSFTDNFPPGLIVNDANLTGITCQDGTLDIVSGESNISYSGGMVPAGEICEISISLLIITEGLLENISEDLTSSLGNSGNATDEITAICPDLDVIAGSNSPVCEGGTVMLTESGSDAVSWTWTGPGGFMSNAQNPIINNATLAADGIYTVEITDQYGCTETAMVDVMISLLPGTPTEIIGPSVTCPGIDNTPYEIAPTANATSYLWSFTDGTVVINGQGTTQVSLDGITTGGTLSVIAVNACGNSIGMATLAVAIASPAICVLADCSRVSEYIDDDLLETEGMTDVFQVIETLQSNATIKEDWVKIFLAGTEIILDPDFTVELGATFIADIRTCAVALREIEQKK